MRKIFFFLLFFVISVLTYLLINQSINNDKFSFIKKLIPHEIKHTIKYYLFAHKIIENKEKKLAIKNYQYYNVIEYLKFRGHPLKDELKVLVLSISILSTFLASCIICDFFIIFLMLKNI